MGEIEVPQSWGGVTTTDAFLEKYTGTTKDLKKPGRKIPKSSPTFQPLTQHSKYDSRFEFLSDVGEGQKLVQKNWSKSEPTSEGHVNW